MLFAHTEPINYWVLSLKIVPGPRAMPLWHVHNPSHPDAVFRCTDWWAGWFVGNPPLSMAHSSEAPCICTCHPYGMTAAVRCTNSAHIGTHWSYFVFCLCDSSAENEYELPNKSCRNNVHKHAHTRACAQVIPDPKCYLFKCKVLLKWLCASWEFKKCPTMVVTFVLLLSCLINKAFMINSLL